MPVFILLPSAFGCAAQLLPSINLAPAPSAHEPALPFTRAGSCRQEAAGE